MTHPTTSENRQNSGENIPKATTGHDSVRLDHADSGTVVLNSTMSVSDLSVLGAMVKTRRHDKEIGGSVTATDDQGRKILCGSLHDAVASVLDGIGVVGKLLAMTANEAMQDDVSKVGWLICGLAELAHDIDFERGEVEYEAVREKKAGGND